ncbi:SLC13 family permease [Pseudarthrobacter sp. NIBRBAC000502770]|uniref:SLC13 family permease n=1 Tax=Pseudarthrobacter sp. NIBRBAC000502770 TaxID=2590785 RepID=UPI00114069AF|nr:SLC13 family permease [Pseudarthrobacter sp. NIBRBAC000502770]QDG88177.1 C4-dicarboxylate ABC transporter [Pseudarthrobacter sp. NIBRBAC000502770]
MPAIQIISLVILGIILALSIWRKVNVGVLAYAATLVLALISAQDPTKTFSAFPASLVILIIGVTLLFAHAERSGAINWLIGVSLRPIGTRRWLVPCIGFFAGAALSTIGAFPTAPISLLLPILARLAKAYRLNYLVLAIICVWGSNAAGLSPLSPAGALVQTLAAKANVTYSPWEVYGIIMGLHAVLCAVLFYVKGGIRQRATGVNAAEKIDPASIIERTPLNAYSIASLIGLAAMVIGAVGFKLDIGLTAISLALVLQLVFRPKESELIAKVPWSVVLLLSGLVVYLGLLEKIGTLGGVQDAVSHIGSPLLLIVVLTYLTAAVSNVESSTLVVLGIMVPIGFSVAGHDPMAQLAMLVAVVMSAAVVAISPVHIGGALIIGNAHDQQRAYRKMFAVTGVTAAVVPALMAIYPIAIGI